MSNKVELHRKLKEIGYEIGPYASKETLSNVIRLHELAMDNKGIDVAKLNDLALRKNLTEAGLTVGPVTNHTRSIYQRKLLEILTNETSEGQEDEQEIQESVSTTPPSRTTRSSIARDTSITSSPGRVFPKEYTEPRIPLTRVDIEDKINQNTSSSYPSAAQNKSSHSSSFHQETITHSYSPQRSTSKTESRVNSSTTYGLRNPYDFTNDEPVIIRHEHKATPFRPTNFSSLEATSTNSNRFVPSTSSARTDLNEIRSRISTSTNETKEVKIQKDFSTSNTADVIKKDQMTAPAKSGGTILYTGIAVTVALLVFIFYLWFEN